MSAVPGWPSAPHDMNGHLGWPPKLHGSLMQAQPLWEAVSAKTERAARRGAGTKGSVDGAERSTALARMKLLMMRSVAAVSLGSEVGRRQHPGGARAHYP